MKRLRGVLAVMVTLVVAVGLSTADAATSKTSKKSSSANQSVLQKMGSATTGFFKTVADTVTLKKFTSSSKSSSKK
jgi:hypothetical protein